MHVSSLSLGHNLVILADIREVVEGIQMQTERQAPLGASRRDGAAGKAQTGPAERAVYQKPAA